MDLLTIFAQDAVFAAAFSQYPYYRNTEVLPQDRVLHVRIGESPKAVDLVRSTTASHSQRNMRAANSLGVLRVWQTMMTTASSVTT